VSRSVFVLVLNHNGERWLERCLRSLLACPTPGLEIVLLDNASTDGSVALARSLSPRLRVLQNERNLGFCAGNNVGIAYALAHGADYVALLNNDTYVAPDWMDRLLEVGESDPAIGVLGPVQLAYDGDDFNSWTLTALPKLVDSLRRQNAPGVWFPVEWVEGSCLVAKRGVLERVGMLDPIFFTFFEEADLCRRARAAGFQVAIVPSSKIHHYRGGFFGQPSQTTHRDFLLLRNSMIYNSTDPRASLLGNLQGLALNNAVHLRDALFRQGNLRLWLQASGSVLAHLPSLYRKWRADRLVLSH
jgi:GT2 family glycosyltransferase